MINNISWQGYWTTIALLSTGYYLVIYLLYYRNDFKLIFHGKEYHKPATIPALQVQDTTSIVKTTDPTLFDEGTGEDFKTPSQDAIEHQVYACIDEINAFFEQSKRNKCIKSEMIDSLHRLLNKYPNIKSSAYKASLTNVMITECEHICSIHLNADDVVRVWVG